MIVIPNSILFTNSVQVMTPQPPPAGPIWPLAWTTTPPWNRLDRCSREPLKPLTGVLAAPTPEVDIVSFGDSAIDFVVRYWTRSQIAIVRRTRTQVMVALKPPVTRPNSIFPTPFVLLTSLTRPNLMTTIPSPMGARQNPRKVWDRAVGSPGQGWTCHDAGSLSCLSRAGILPALQELGVTAMPMSNR